MSTVTSIVPPYRIASPPRSAVLKNPTEDGGYLPSVDEITAAQAELRMRKQQALEKKARTDQDANAFFMSMRSLKELDKGKHKAVEKVKRERAYTPVPDVASPQLSATRTRFPSVASSSSQQFVKRPSLDNFKAPSDKKKKKRKREPGDSDGEPDFIRPRKASPTPSIQHTFAQKALKAPPAAKLSTGQDFSIPAPTSLIPTRPPVPPPPVAGPSKCTDVQEDFSKLKPPQQVLVTTYYTSVEPYLRNFTEEDVGFLEYTGDEVTPYIIPKLGRPYADVWAEEDTALYGAPLPGTAAVHGTYASEKERLKRNRRWEPATLMDPDLLVEERGHAPLTERLMSALLPVWGDPKSVKAVEEAMEGRSGGGTAAAAARDKMNVGDLEVRVRESVRWLGLGAEEPDTDDPLDDPIASALRHAQGELRRTVAANRARKTRLAAVVRDRLAYQEYVDGRETLDRAIGALYARLQKKDAPKPSKKKKRPTVPELGVGPPEKEVPPSPAALGLGQDSEMVLSVPEQLMGYVRTRRAWVDQVGGVFEERERERRGAIVGVPERERSLFEGVEEEVRRELEMVGPAISVVEGKGDVKGKGKGKGRAVDGHAMPNGSPMELG